MSKINKKKQPITSEFLGSLLRKETKAETIAKKVIKKPQLIPELLTGFLSDIAGVKFKSAKVLVLVSGEKPELLYPHFDFFAGQLDNKNNILKWNAIDVIANLTIVDNKKKFDEIYKKFYQILQQGNLISANHVIAGSAMIVKAKPYLEQKITLELLKSEKIELPTEECRNILKGNIITAFEQYYDFISNKKAIINFIKKELTNTRNSTRIKTEKFIKMTSK